MAETLRLTSLNVAGMAWERAEGGRLQRHCASTPCSRGEKLRLNS